jgi:Raf kinase inhibitor-like YbhB/YbcL family protein
MRSSRQPHSSVRHFGAGALLAFAACCLGACASDKASSGDSPTPGGGAAGAGTSAAGTAGMPIAGGSSAAGSAGSTSSGGQGDSTTGGAGGSGVAGGGTGGTGGTSGISGISGAAGASNEPFTLKSSAFKEGDEIPLMYKCATVNPKGQNVSPPLSWGPGPSGTKSYAVVLMHLPSPEHWVIWDIPADITSLPENIEHTAEPAVPAHSKQSLANLDGFMGIGYLGPCPQAPNSPQSYRFTLYALDVDTLPGLTATSGPGAAAAVVKAHLVPGSQGVSLTGTQIQTP